ncbi:MAG: hypothetical protein V3R95_04030 [Dehalococcoidia bacterium]
MRLSSTTGGVIFFFVLAATIAGGAFLGASVAADVTSPGLQRVLLEDPAQFTDVPAWAARSDAGFTGFGGLPALPGAVFRSGVIGEHEEGVLTVDSAKAQTIVEYTQPLRFFLIRAAESPLAVGDAVVVRLVDGEAAGFLRLLVNIEQLDDQQSEQADGG